MGEWKKREAGKLGSWEAGKNSTLRANNRSLRGKEGSWEAMKLGKPGEQEFRFAALTTGIMECWNNGMMGWRPSDR